MAILFSMLPVYLFGNLHCFGMCGPLVMMLAKHRYRMFYFIGRLTAFSFFGLLSGSLGIVLKFVFEGFNGSALLSFFFACLFAGLGFLSLSAKKKVLPDSFAKLLSKTSQRLALLLLKDRPETTFFFGLATPLLPCGQSLYVFSISALLEDPFLGALNGFLFALLTSPSLFAALHLQRRLQSKNYFSDFFAYSAFFACLLVLLRGFAELNLISHLSFEVPVFNGIHFVLF